MNAMKSILLIALFGSATALAEPPSDSTIRELLRVMQAQQLLENMRGQIDSMMDREIQQLLSGKLPTPKQRQTIANMKSEVSAVVNDVLQWEKMEPMYTRQYRETFTEDELLGILAFYRTPAGQALTRKMPLLMEKVMRDVQAMVAGMSPRLQKINEAFMAEMRAQTSTEGE